MSITPWKELFLFIKAAPNSKTEDNRANQRSIPGFPFYHSPKKRPRMICSTEKAEKETTFLQL